MKTIKSKLRFGLLVLFVTGCAGLQSHRTSSVVDYLYPNRSDVIEKPSTPTLKLPLNVGIVFVPEGEQTVKTGGFGNKWAETSASYQLNEKQKTELMQKISAEFKQLPFVKAIEIIPSPYLKAGGSFTNLDQIRTMYGIDVIVLLSYDQVQHTDESTMSLTSWTLIGAYVFKGEKNDTSTMIDAAVYHIQSRKMLFRAPGISQVKGAATAVNLSEQLRKDSNTGLDEAAKDLVINLKEQLELFKTKVKEAPEEYKIEKSSGYTGGHTGGGSIDSILALISVAMGAIAIWERKTHKL